MDTKDEQQKLLGDRVEEMLKKAKVDKVAQLYEKIAKRPCGCKKRKAKLNKLHQDYLDKQKEK